MDGGMKQGGEWMRESNWSSQLLPFLQVDFGELKRRLSGAQTCCSDTAIITLSVDNRFSSQLWLKLISLTTL